MTDSRDEKDRDEEEVTESASVDEFEEDDDDESPESPVWCSHCGSQYIRESSRRTLLDWLLILGCVRTFRCHSCYRRFHQFVAPGRKVKTWRPEDARREHPPDSASRNPD